MSGRLALVFGPSGAGKDTLPLAAAESLAGRPRSRFVRRVITRRFSAGDEQNEAASLCRQAAGAFALDRSAHGLHYGNPADIPGDRAAGTTVVASVSRTEKEAAARFPVRPIEITAPVALRAARRAARERESETVVADRLKREVPLDAGWHVSGSSTIAM